MPLTKHTVRAYVSRLLAERSLDELDADLRPSSTEAPAGLTGSGRLDAAAVERRWDAMDGATEVRDALRGDDEELASYAGNIENCIGTARLPVGVAGPLRVNGLHAAGDYWVPLATTEGALVASYSRGARVISEAGGCTSVLLAEGVDRAPGFVFESLREAGWFVAWVTDQEDAFKDCVSKTTRHGSLQKVRAIVEGNRVFLRLTFATGDAAGQNMVTFATDRICAWIVEHSPVTPSRWFVEANLSGDKKASLQAFMGVRGRKVSAEVVVPRDVCRRRLHCEPKDMVEFYDVSMMGGILSGIIGVQGHYANGLAGLFLATGQDVACVAEAAMGVTRIEATTDGDLYVAVTLPNLIVGTVGGGTGLATASACLRLLGLDGPGNARALAEVTAACALAGEISICAALAAGHFSRAHHKLARIARDR